MEWDSIVSYVMVWYGSALILSDAENSMTSKGIAWNGREGVPSQVRYASVRCQNGQNGQESGMEWKATQPRNAIQRQKHALHCTALHCTALLSNPFDFALIWSSLEFLLDSTGSVYFIGVALIDFIRFPSEFIETFMGFNGYVWFRMDLQRFFKVKDVCEAC